MLKIVIIFGNENQSSFYIFLNVLIYYRTKKKKKGPRKVGQTEEHK